MWQMVGIFWDRFEEVLERERELQAIVRGVGDSLREDNQLGREEKKKEKKNWDSWNGGFGGFEWELRKCVRKKE